MKTREQLVMEICGEDAKLQYDGKDEDRVANLAAQFTQSSMLMLEALGQFNAVAAMDVDENSADMMKGARADVVMAWGALAVAVSKIAGVMRIDGDETFNRILNVVDEDPDVSGL